MVVSFASVLASAYAFSLIVLDIALPADPGMGFHAVSFYLVMLVYMIGKRVLKKKGGRTVM